MCLACWCWGKSFQDADYKLESRMEFESWPDKHPAHCMDDLADERWRQIAAATVIEIGPVEIEPGEEIAAAVDDIETQRLNCSQRWIALTALGDCSGDCEEQRLRC